MQEKILLINSMQKLIHHIVVCKKNQQEIFASLSKNDFKKIISNLQDENQRLRKISLALISQLLHNNPQLKEKFCNIMGIPLCPGRIALNSKLCSGSSRSKNNISVDMNKNIKEVFGLLKQPVSQHEKQCLFWFINYDNKNASLRLEYLTSNHALNLNELLDPVDSMIGFILPDRVQAKRIEQVVQGVSEPRRKSEYQASTSGKLVNNYFKPQVYKPEMRQIPNLNQSLNLTPGYSTDRDNNYRPAIGQQTRQANTSMYQESPQQTYQKPAEIYNNINQMKPHTMDIEHMNRSKYAGIKLTTNPNTTKGKESKYYDEHPSFVGSMTTTGAKTISFNNPQGSISHGAPIGANSGSKNLSMTIRERGYETLREKKIVQKYP